MVVPVFDVRGTPIRGYSLFPKNFKAENIFLHFLGEVRRPNCNLANKVKNTRQGAIRLNGSLEIRAKKPGEEVLRPNGKLAFKAENFVGNKI